MSGRWLLKGGDWTVERARAYLDKMDPSIAALFPDHFVDSELGEVPAGWEVKTVGTIASIVGGTTPSTKQAQYWEGRYSLLGNPQRPRFSLCARSSEN